MRQTKLFDQALQALGLFKRIQIFALNIFYQRHGGCSLVRHLAHKHRHLIQPREPSSTKTPLTSNDFVFARIGAANQLAHQNRLHDALRLDALGQLVQRAFVHARTGLVDTRHHVAQRKLMRHTAFVSRCRCRGGFHLGAQQYF